MSRENLASEEAKICLSKSSFIIFGIVQTHYGIFHNCFLFFFEPFPYFYAHDYQLFLPRMLDDDMRSMMAIDWMSREQEIPGTIDKEMRNTLEELEMSRRSGRELRLKIFYSLSILSYSQEVAFYLHLGKIFWLNICLKSSASFYP